MTKYLSRGLILALLVFLKTPSKADSIPEIVATTEPAIVEIVTTDSTGAPKALGTGFFISPDGLVVASSALPTPAIDAKAPLDSGNAFFDKKEYDKAISAFTEAIRLDPNLVPAYNNRGTAYAKQGNRDKADADFATAKRLKAGP
jgi:tetratricopeptide (TPR) repeat protein